MNLKKKFVIGAASVALVAGMGGVAPAAFAVDGTLTLPGYAKSLTRLAGLDRVQTSLAVADKQFGKGMHNSVNRPTRLYIASAADGNMVDAASAGMLQDGPIVFVYGSSYVSTAVGEHVKNFEKNTGYNGYANISEVVAIGGDGAVSDAALKNVAGALKVSKTSRLGGKDRYETSVAIADYIYGQAQKAVKGDGYFDRNGGLIINAATTNLNVVYIANGADEHVVDSMVSGTLDNGPVLLATPDGKIPEPVAEFIKKTLPEQFAALGGAPTVPDSTIQDAWLIKALANKWDTSYSVPDLKKKVDNLQRIVNGDGNSAKYDALDFKGMERSYQDAVNIYNAWHGEYTKNTNAVNSKYFAQDMKGKVALTTAAATLLDPTSAPGQAFLALYGTNDWVQKDIEGYFDSWTEKGVKYARSFDFDRFTKDKLGSDFIDPATDALNKVWTGIQADFSALQTNNAGAAYVAMASQDFPDLAIPTSGTKGIGVGADLKVPMAAVNFVADYARSAVETLLKNKKAELASTSQSLRSELDKIAPKTELRLGGADRFETAQLIANQFAKTYGKVMTNGAAVDFNEAYIASGYRMADSLAAGQLAMGPILLVKGTEKDGKELPEFTQNVAKNLMCWTKQANIDVYGIGGEGVLADSALEATIALIDNPNCKVAPAPAATGLLDNTVNAYPSEDVDVIMHVSGDKNAPTLTLGDITKSDKKTSIKGTGDAKIAGVANQDKAGNSKTGAIHFTVGKDVVPGTYYAAVKDANGNAATVTIIVANKFEVTPAKFIGTASDSVTLSAKLNGTTVTYGTGAGKFSCTSGDTSVTINNSGKVEFAAGKLVDGKEVTLTCKAGDETDTVQVIGYTNQIAAAAYTAPTLSNKNATPVANTAKTAGATYSYKVKTDTDSLTVEKGGQMSITIDPATGDLTVTDAGYANSTNKTVVVTVTASKSGMAPKDADVTITTNR